MTPSPELVAAMEVMRRFGCYGMPLLKATQATTANTWLKHDTRCPTPRKKKNEHQS